MSILQHVPIYCIYIYLHIIIKISEIQSPCFLVRLLHTPQRRFCWGSTKCWRKKNPCPLVMWRRQGEIAVPSQEVVVSINGGTPIAGRFISWKFRTKKMDDLGYPMDWKPPSGGWWGLSTFERKAGEDTPWPSTKDGCYSRGHAIKWGSPPYRTVAHSHIVPTARDKIVRRENNATTLFFPRKADGHHCWASLAHCEGLERQRSAAEPESHESNSPADWELNGKSSSIKKGNERQSSLDMELGILVLGMDQKTWGTIDFRSFLVWTIHKLGVPKFDPHPILAVIGLKLSNA